MNFSHDPVGHAGPFRLQSPFSGIFTGGSILRRANTRLRYSSPTRSSRSGYSRSGSGPGRIIGYVIVLLLLVAVGFGAWHMLSDLDGPSISLSPDTGSIAPSKNLRFAVSDPSGVRSLKVTIHRKDQSLVLLDRTFTSPSNRQEVEIGLKESGLRDGTFQLEAEARDMAFMGLGSGNSRTARWEMRLDGQAPQVRVRTTAPALRRGGMAAIGYTVSEDVETTGVRIKDHFFPAFRQASGIYFCLFPWALDVTKAEFLPEIVSVDLAGNESRTRVILNASDHNYKNDTLNISDKFLDSKMPALAHLAPEAGSNLEIYLHMNNVVRRENENTLMELGTNTAPTMLWQGAFKRLPGSASRAGFGDHRTYMHNGTKIDEQTHMGQDLASTARAPIPAANAGTVVYAGDLGIYGLMVLIDHGLGLQSLYSHMSEIGVAVGDTVKQGDIIGKTGTTGLAGGDHLHFGMVLHGIQIQPTDWFDAKWVRNMVTGRLQDADRAVQKK